MGGFNSFKRFLRRYKKEYSSHFLLSKDKKEIEELAQEGERYMQKLKEIDAKLIAIQNSTRTTIPGFSAIHNYFRMRSQWYYQWHLNPYASKVHFGALGVYVVLLVAGIIFGALGQPYQYAKAANFVSTQSGYWNIGTTWGGTCTSSCVEGTDYPGSSDNVTISAGHTVTLNSNANAANVTIQSTGVLDLGNGGYTLTLAGNGSTATVLTVNGTLAPGNSTVKYTATNSGGNVNITTTTYNSLQLSGAETYDLTGNLTGTNDLTGNLTINSGATLKLRPGSVDYDMTFVNLTVNSGGILDASGSSSTITASGNWNHANGTFYRGTSTVKLTGNGTVTTNPNVYLDTTRFHNLWIAFAGYTTTLSNSLGVAGNLNIGPGTVVNGVTYPFYVFNSTSGAQPVSIDNNTVNLVSVYYIMLANTVITGSSKYRNLQFVAYNGTNTYTATLAGDVYATSGNIIVKADVNGGTAVLDTAGYRLDAGNQLIIGNSSSTARYAKLVANNSIIDVEDDVILYSSDANGNNIIEAGSSTWTVSGDWTMNEAYVADSSGFQAGTSSVNIGANRATAAETIKSNGAPFYHLTIDNNGTAPTNDNVTLIDALDVNGNFSVSDGELITNGLAVNTAGDVTIGTDGLVTSTSTWTFDGTTTYTDNTTTSQNLGAVVESGTSVSQSSKMQVGSLTINSGTHTMNTHNLTVNGSVNLNGGSLTGGSGTLTIGDGGADDNFTIANASSTFIAPASVVAWDFGTYTHTAGTANWTDNDSEFALTSMGQTLPNDTYHTLTLEDAGVATFEVISGPLTIEGNLNINQSVSNTFQITSGTVAVYGSITNNGILYNSGGTIEVKGNLTNNGTIYSDAGANILFNGGMTQYFTANGASHYAIDVGANTEVIQQGGSIDVEQLNLQATSSIYDAASESFTITNLSNEGTFQLTGDNVTATITNGDTNSGTIEYTATSGSRNIKNWVYYNLKINGSGGIFRLPAAATTTVNGNLLIVAGTLNTNDGTTDRNLTVGGNVSFSTGGTLTANSSTITVAGDWNSSSGAFNYGTSTVNLTGTGTLTTAGDAWTPAFYNLTAAAAGKTTTLLSHVAIANVLTFGTGTISGPGYILTMKKNGGVPFVNAGASINLYRIIYNPSSDTVTVAGGNYGTLSALELYANGAGVTFNLGGDLTLQGSLWIVANDGVSDTVFSTQNYNISATSIQIGAYSNSGGTLNFGSSTVDIGTDGFYINNSGGSYTLNLNSSSVSCAGPWTLSAGSGAITQNPGTSTITFDGTANQTITTSAQPFNHLVINNTGTSGSNKTIVSGSLDVNGLLELNNGELDVSTNDPNVNLANGMSIGASASLNLTDYTGTWTYDGTGTLTDSRSPLGDLKSFVVDGSSITLTLGSNIKATNVTVGADDTLNLSSGGYTLEITGSGTPLVINGTFDKGSGSTVKYSSSAATNIALVGYENLRLSGATTYSLTGNLTGSNALSGNLTIDSGATLDATTNSYNMSLAGNWTNYGSFVPRNSTITFTKTSGTQTLYSDPTTGNNLFYNLAHSGAGTLQIEGRDIDIDGSFSNLAGTFNANGFNINIAGNWNNSASFNASTGTVVFDGTGLQEVTSSGSAFNHISVTNASPDGIKFTDALTVNGNFVNVTVGSQITFKEGTENVIANINWQGGSGDVNDLIKLRSATAGLAWKLLYTSITNADYLDVQDSNNLGSLLVVNHAKDSGNNTNWYLISSYSITTTTPHTAGAGWAETLTASDFYGNTATSADIPVTMTASSSNVKFYTSNTYANETNSYTLSGGAATIYIKAFNLSNETITITASDDYGRSVTSGNILIENDAPSSSIISPQTNAVVGAGVVQIKGQASDTKGGVVAYVKIQVVKDDGTTVVDWANATNTGDNFSTFSYNWQITTSGIYTVKSKAIDSIGAAETPQSGIVIKVDAEVPSVVIEKPAANEWITESTYEIRGQSTDLGDSSITKVELSFDSGKNWFVAENTGTNFSRWRYTWSNYQDGKYNLWAKATDGVGNVSQTYTVSTGVDRTAPSQPTNLKIFDISNRIAGAYQTLLDFSASKDDISGLKGYEIYRDGRKIAVSTDTYYVDQKLQAMQYSYQVKAVDEVGNSSESEKVNIELIPKETSKPTLSDIKATPSKVVTKDNKTMAVITWKTDRAATSQVFYGLGGAKANKTEPDIKLNTAHSVILENLNPSTTYHFSVLSKDIYGNQVESQDMTFTTTASPEKESILELILKTLQKAFEWTKKVLASPLLDKLGIIKSLEQVTPSMMVFDVSNPDIQKFQALIKVVDKSSFILERSTDGQNFTQIANVSDRDYYLDQNLKNSETYYYRVVGVQGTVSVRPAGVDTTPPVISDIKAKNLGASQDKAIALITWQTDKLTTGELQIEGKSIKEDGLNQSHTIFLEDLKPATTYKFKVSSVTEQGVSAISGDQAFTTLTSPEEKTILQLILETLQKVFSSFRNWLSV